MSKFNWLRALAMALGLCWTLTAALARAADAVQPPWKPNEAKILAALDQKTELEFVDQPLSDVVDYLKQRHEIEIQLDTKALTDSGIGTDTPITKNVKGISLESALELMLRELDMTYVVCDEVMYLTTKSAAGNLLSTRTYPVADLVVREDGAALGDDYQSLIELITTSVGPKTWDEVGGAGSIQEFRNARAVVISQTFAVHRQVERLLASVRAARQEQAAAAPKQAEEEVHDDETPYVKVYRLPAGWASPAAVNVGGGAGGAVAQPGQPAAVQGKDNQGQAKPRQVQPQMGGGMMFGAGGAAMGGGMGRSRAAATPQSPTAGELSKAIPAILAPDSWDLSGGPGAIRAAGNSLIVRHTRPVHREIARLLEQLK
jgi:hypothetical protein